MDIQDKQFRNSLLGINPIFFNIMNEILFYPYI